MVCRGRFTPADDNKYRIKDDEENNDSDDYIKTTTKLPPLQVKPNNIRSSTFEGTPTDNCSLQKPQSMNKKDLSTISERTERSMTQTREANALRMQQQTNNRNNEQQQEQQVYKTNQKNVVPKLGIYFCY